MKVGFLKFRSTLWVFTFIQSESHIPIPEVNQVKESNFQCGHELFFESFLQKFLPKEPRNRSETLRSNHIAELIYLRCGLSMSEAKEINSYKSKNAGKARCDPSGPSV